MKVGVVFEEYTKNLY